MVAYALFSAVLPLMPTSLDWQSAGYSGLEIGVVLIWCGFRSFDGKRPMTRLLLVLPAAPLLACWLVGTVSADWPEANRAALLVHCIVAAAQATYILRARTSWGGPRSIAAYSVYVIAVSVAGPALMKGTVLTPQGAEILIALVDHAMTVVLTLSVIAMVGERDFAVAVQAARHDPLTGALNRMGLAEAIAGRTTPQTLLLVDLDHFKIINDRFGHDCGDEVLRDFAGRTNATIGDAALLARVGGEEFLIVSDHQSIENASRLAEAVRAAANREPACIGQSRIPFTVSIGVTLRQGQEDFQLAVKRADDALYEAKAQGRDRVVTC